MYKFLEILGQLIILFVFLSNVSPSNASFYYGEPCNSQNTAIISTGRILMPLNIHCVEVEMVSNISSISPKYLSFPTAQSLAATHLNITKLPVNLLQTVPHAEMVDLSYNQIIRIHPKRINKFCPDIDKLLLSNNLLRLSRKAPLLVSDTLRTLSLSRNRIRKLPEGAFRHLPKLEVLFLDGNYLTAVSAKVFAPLRNLQYLHLGQNFLSVVPDKSLMPPKLRFYIIKNNKKIVDKAKNEKVPIK